MKLKLKMAMKVLAAIKKCLISVFIRLGQNDMVIQNYKLLKKLKMKRVVLLLKNLSD